MTDEKKPLDLERITPKLGADLFATAESADNTARGKYIVAQMTEELAGMRKAREQQAILQQIVDFRQRRIDALKAGAFQIGARDRVVYDDETLRGTTIETPDGTHFL